MFFVNYTTGKTSHPNLTHPHWLTAFDEPTGPQMAHGWWCAICTRGSGCHFDVWSRSHRGDVSFKRCLRLWNAFNLPGNKSCQSARTKESVYDFSQDMPKLIKRPFFCHRLANCSIVVEKRAGKDGKKSNNATCCCVSCKTAQKFIYSTPADVNITTRRTPANISQTQSQWWI